MGIMAHRGLAKTKRLNVYLQRIHATEVVYLQLPINQIERVYKLEILTRECKIHKIILGLHLSVIGIFSDIWHL